MGVKVGFDSAKPMNGAVVIGQSHNITITGNSYTLGGYATQFIQYSESWLGNGNITQSGNGQP